MKQLFLALFVLTCLLAAGIWWSKNSNIDHVEVPQTPALDTEEIVGDLSDDSLETASNQVLTGEIEESAVATNLARNIVFVPDNNLDRSQAEEELKSEFQQSVDKLVKSSLEGVVEDSINIGRLMNQCGGVPRTEKQIQNNLQNVNKKFRARKKWDVGSGENMSFESFGEYEVFMQDKYEKCRDIRSVFSSDLHKEIALLAAAGNKNARYLFAMWPPLNGGRFRTGKMPEWLEYQNQALAYTWQNVDEGSPLGLLAFGQSFAYTGGGFFTPMNLRYAQVFFLASKKCGLQSEWLESEVSKYIVDLSSDISGSKLNRTEIQADELTALFCQ